MKLVRDAPAEKSVRFPAEVLEDVEGIRGLRPAIDEKIVIDHVTRLVVIDRKAMPDIHFRVHGWQRDQCAPRRLLNVLRYFLGREFTGKLVT